MSISVKSQRRRHSASAPRGTQHEPKPAESNPRRGTCSPQTTLAGAKSGQVLCIRHISGQNGHTQRLRELGMYEGQTIQVLLAGNPLICLIGDGRFGICHLLARHIMVEPLAAEVVSKQSA